MTICRPRKSQKKVLREKYFRQWQATTIFVNKSPKKGSAGKIFSVMTLCRCQKLMLSPKVIPKMCRKISNANHFWRWHISVIAMTFCLHHFSSTINATVGCDFSSTINDYCHRQLCQCLFVSRCPRTPQPPPTAVFLSCMNSNGVEIGWGDQSRPLPC